MTPAIKDFFKLESASGIILLVVAGLAMVFANSPLSAAYEWFLDLPVQVRVGALDINKPMILWINDGLMAIFFFLVGLELKREILIGELSSPEKIALPGIAALGGMAVPAFIYALFNMGDENAIHGWAVPTATDIAFALGVLSLLGSRVPSSLKVFLVSLAIFDDVGAIIIIALFYTDNLSFISLMIALACIAVLFVLSRRGVSELTPYVIFGVVMWVAVLKSGVHATLAGVILALFIPMTDKNRPDRSPLRELEHDLHTVVAFVVLPLFAFANAGISFSDVGLDYLLDPVPLGIALGLFFGKQVGVFGFCWIAVKAGIAELPRNVTWGNLYGIALLCGIGFTMSLFIGSLAFDASGLSMIIDERLGIISGSVLSAVCGYLVLALTLKEPARDEHDDGNP